MNFTFDTFGPLDELIQVIYQASHRFILLSRVDFDALIPSWQIYVGLADSGRWWKGKWEESDVNSFVGKNVSSDLLEAFVDNIAKTITQGELFVSGLGTESVSEMKLIFGPGGTKPLPISLSELTSQEALAFTTNELFTLGLNAQRRNCKLNPPAFPTYIGKTAGSSERLRAHSPPPTKGEPFHLAACTEPHLRAEENRRRLSSPPPAPPKVSHSTTTGGRTLPRKPTEEKTSTVPLAPKPKPKMGPIKKKARKVQDMEFASDDE